MPEIADEQLRTAVKDYFNKVVELYSIMSSFSDFVLLAIPMVASGLRSSAILTGSTAKIETLCDT